MKPARSSARPSKIDPPAPLHFPITPVSKKPQTEPEIPTVLREIDQLCEELSTAVRTSVDRALRIGLRLLVIHRESGESGESGGFRAAIERIEGHRIPRSTAYRWFNAAARALARHQGIADDNGNFEPSALRLPSAPDEIAADEAVMATVAAATSMRRLMLGSAATGEESRMDELIDASERGDALADAVLERVAAGELTLVQAIRARAGAAATKDKTRADPVYLDIDGATGEAKGLFVRSLITISNTFDHWEDLDETARGKAKAAWKALVAKIPKELR